MTVQGIVHILSIKFSLLQNSKTNLGQAVLLSTYKSKLQKGTFCIIIYIYNITFLPVGALGGTAVVSCDTVYD